MRIISISREGQPVGTFAEDQILPMLQQGILLRTDKAWSHELTKWDDLEMVVPLPPEALWPKIPSPIPVVAPEQAHADASGQPPALNYESEPVDPVDPGDRATIPWRWALVTGCIGCILEMGLLTLSWMGVITDNMRDQSVVQTALAVLGMILTSIFIFVAGVTCYTLHDRCCGALPSVYRKSSGVDSVYLLLIPYYNLYVVFPVYLRLADNYARWAHNRKYPINPATRPLAIWIAITWVVSWVGFIKLDHTLPLAWVAVLTLPVLLILRIKFYRLLIQQAHDLHQHPSTGSAQGMPGSQSPRELP